MDPVADVLAGAVELGAQPGEHVGDLPRDELLDVLPGSVVVRAVGDGRPQPYVRAQARTSMSEEAFVEL